MSFEPLKRKKIKKLTVPELRRLVKEKGITFYSRFKKDQLVKILTTPDPNPKLFKKIPEQDPELLRPLTSRKMEDSEGIKADLAKYGYTKVECLDEEQVDLIKQQLKADLKELGIRPRKFKKEDWIKTSYGVVKGYQAGWWTGVRMARTSKNVLRVFADLHEVKIKELVTSFDCLNIMPPYSSLPTKDRPWPHRDQAFEDHGFHTAQGILNLNLNGDHDGGFIVYPGTHRWGRIFSQLLPREVGDWVRFPEKITDKLESIKVNAVPGELILFDSRVIHHNCPPSDGSETKDDSVESVVEDGSETDEDIFDRYRLAVYVCCLPREQVPEKQQERRRAIFAKKQTTNHFPDHPVIETGTFQGRLDKRTPTIIEGYLNKYERWTI